MIADDGPGDDTIFAPPTPGRCAAKRNATITADDHNADTIDIGSGDDTSPPTRLTRSSAASARR